MYQGFNIEKTSVYEFLFGDILFDDCLHDTNLKKEVLHLANEFDAQFSKPAIHNNLEKYRKINGDLDASAIQEDSFPQWDFDIFISHSHKDKKMAKAFAMSLQEVFGLKVFVDSAVWGYFNTLLKGTRCNTTLLDTVSHAHMMLTMALMTMIDRTECLFFLNTPKSINLDEKFNMGTYSPWLYTEIGISRMIEKKLSRRPCNFSKENLRERKLLKSSMWYQTDISHLTTLDADDLKSWASHCQKTFEHPLDVLYDLYPLEKSIK